MRYTKTQLAGLLGYTLELKPYCVDCFKLLSDTGNNFLENLSFSPFPPFLHHFHTPFNKTSHLPKKKIPLLSCGHGSRGSVTC